MRTNRDRLGIKNLPPTSCIPSAVPSKERSHCFFNLTLKSVSQPDVIHLVGHRSLGETTTPPWRALEDVDIINTDSNSWLLSTIQVVHIAEKLLLTNTSLEASSGHDILRNSFGPRMAS